MSTIFLKKRTDESMRSTVRPKTDTGNLLAQTLGFEPRQAGLESAVLPLHYVHTSGALPTELRFREWTRTTDSRIVAALSVELRFPVGIRTQISPPLYQSRFYSRRFLVRPLLNPKLVSHNALAPSGKPMRIRLYQPDHLFCAYRSARTAHSSVR